MFEQPQNTTDFSDTLKRIATFSAISAGIGFGTCGVGFVASQASSFFQYVAIAGGALFFLSLATLFLACIGLIITGIMDRFRK